MVRLGKTSWAPRRRTGHRTDEDDGSYLRASVTYTDMFDSGKAAAKVTTTPVEDRTVANAAPSFADQDDVEDVENEVNTVGTQVNREVAENSAEGTPIGKPVSASDADNDILVYTLGGDHASSFDISSTSGQLKSKGNAGSLKTCANPA